jgi:hypothetical protein
MAENGAVLWNTWVQFGFTKPATDYMFLRKHLKRRKFTVQYSSANYIQLAIYNLQTLFLESCNIKCITNV